MNKLRNITASGFVISTVNLGDYYETMVFDPSTDDECECIRSSSSEDAQKAHVKMVKKYTPTQEAIELANAIVKADNVAQTKSDIEDRGTCNLDCVTINLKGKRKQFIKQIELLSGISLSEGKYSGWRVIHFNVSGQANRRTEMVKVAADYMYAQGFDVSIDYQID